MKIALGSDHGGFEYKNAVQTYLINKKYDVIDVGTSSKESCHYPIYAKEVGKLVSNKEADFGVLICTTGEGVCIVANKVKGVRCGIGYNDDVSIMMRKHNDANVIAFGQAHMALEDVLRRVDLFLHTDFEGGRHQTRVDLIKDFEK